MLPTLDGPLPLSARPMRESDVDHVARTGTRLPPDVRPLAMQNTPPGKGVVASSGFVDVGVVGVVGSEVPDGPHPDAIRAVTNASERPRSPATRA